jgi:HJR/Mrr/RecB family endonuclease
MPKLKDKFTIPQLQLELEHHRRFSNLSINLLDILKGNLIHKFNEYNIPYNDADLYYKWLAVNTRKFPYNFV